MYALDFKYDEKRLSDFRFIICDFDYSSGFVSKNIGSNIVFNKVSHNLGKVSSISGASYTECISCTFDICKDPDYFDNCDLYIRQEEFREIVRWLNRDEFLELSFLCDDQSYTMFGSFNFEKITIAEKVCGIRLIFETNSPFCFGDEVVFNYQCTDENDIKNADDYSDHIGRTYPLMKIKCMESGDLVINNLTDNVQTKIKNCSSGEEIAIDSIRKTIVSSNAVHDIFDDFNYAFFYMQNTYSNISNPFSASLQCEIEIRYRPVIKFLP